MSFKYLFKEPNKRPELRTFEGSNDDFYNCSVMEDILKQPFSCVGYVCFGDIILYFDDCGIANKDKKLIEYNCNIPSNNPNFQNQLFGNICAIKFENMGREDEKAIDVSEKDFDALCNMFFEVSKEEIYSTKNVGAYFTNFFR